MQLHMHLVRGEPVPHFASDPGSSPRITMQQILWRTHTFLGRARTSLCILFCDSLCFAMLLGLGRPFTTHGVSMFCSWYDSHGAVCYQVLCAHAPFGIFNLCHHGKFALSRNSLSSLVTVWNSPPGHHVVGRAVDVVVFDVFS